nr:asparaginase [Clostridia bacterium]
MDKKIFVIMTGGTICSAPDYNNKRDSNASAVRSYIIDGFRASSSPYRESAEFDVYNLAPSDILSENMTLSVWDMIIAIFRGIRFEDYSGIIVLHGTDTLAYTSAMLSIVLAGIPVPVIMVSAQLPLVKKFGDGFVPEERTNGYANFRTAAELILNGIKPNVYAVYRNDSDVGHTPGEMLVHYGAELE